MARPASIDIQTAYKKISTFFDVRGRMPSMSEIASLCGFKSKNSSFYLIEKLRAKRLIKKDKKGMLIVSHARQIEKPLQLLGTIPAGFASPVEDAVSDTLSLSDLLIRNREASYLLKVQGDSMQDAGIYDGDMVVFERTADFKPGDIVVALTEDGYTLKYLRKESGGKNSRYYLEPANDAYPKIYPREGQVVGVVISTFRTYQKK